MYQGLGLLVLRTVCVTLGKLLNFSGLRFDSLMIWWSMRPFLKLNPVLVDSRLLKPRIGLRQSIFLGKLDELLDFSSFIPLPGEDKRLSFLLS